MKVGEKMSIYTLETAKKHLNAWLKAELAVTTGQSYQIGSRALTRANLNQIREEIKYWRNEVGKIETIQNRRGRNRVIRVVPRDL